MQRDVGLSSTSLSHPCIPPVLGAPAPGLDGPLRGGPWGGDGQVEGEGMEPPSSRSRPLVSRMSRRCHTHLMWFLAGAAAALSRLIAARGALQTDSPAPRLPWDAHLAQPLCWPQLPQGYSDSPKDAQTHPPTPHPHPQKRSRWGKHRRCCCAQVGGLGAALSSEGVSPGLGEHAGMEESCWRCFAWGNSGLGGFGARGEELTASPSLPPSSCLLLAWQLG